MIRRNDAPQTGEVVCDGCGLRTSDKGARADWTSIRSCNQEPTSWRDFCPLCTAQQLQSRVSAADDGAMTRTRRAGSDDAFWMAVAGAWMAHELADAASLHALDDEDFDRALKEASFIADEAVLTRGRARTEEAP